MNTEKRTSNISRSLSRTQIYVPDEPQGRPADAFRKFRSYLSNRELVGMTNHNTQTLVKLHIRFKGKETVMVVSPKKGVIFGRTMNPIYPGFFVDLSGFDAYQNGVSRSHAQILLENGNLHLYDLGSSNGTSLNSQKLTPHIGYRLRDKDLITLGKLEIQLTFEE